MLALVARTVADGIDDKDGRHVLRLTASRKRLELEDYIPNYWDAAAFVPRDPNANKPGYRPMIPRQSTQAALSALESTFDNQGL